MLQRLFDALVTADRLYGGEAVTQRDHALQCAWLAERDGAGPELIVAALLHDAGHLVHHLGDDCALSGVDDQHERTGAALVAQVLPTAVSEPIRLHVAAKRWLCARADGYRSGLSPASLTSLSLQGGSFTPDEADRFLRQPYAAEAISLRRWDDLAKTPGLAVPELEHFWRLVPQLTVRRSRAIRC